MNVKIIFSIAAAIVSLASFYYYLRDILKGITKPHPYTFLIWFITQAIAAAGILFGGGSWGALSLLLGTAIVLVIFFLSLRYGTKNITKADALCLVLALAAIVVWWKFKNPLLSVCMVTLTDLLGYIPTYRKSFFEPWSETLLTWVGSAAANIFSIAALRSYNALTLSYLVTIFLANTAMVLLCLLRRPLVTRPKIH